VVVEGFGGRFGKEAGILQEAWSEKAHGQDEFCTSRETGAVSFGNHGCRQGADVRGLVKPVTPPHNVPSHFRLSLTLIS
jgi:hypothetical protein